MGGEKETLRTKVYKVPVSLPDNTETFLITVIGIPGISEEVSAVQFKPIGKLLGLENERIHRGKGPIDLLIGIDDPQMHSGKARQTPLEWVVFCGQS